MDETKWKNVQDKGGPVVKSKAGRFEVSVWKWSKTVPQPNAREELLQEQIVEMERMLVRYSQWNRITRTWDDVSVWCSVGELRDLANALDALNFSDEP